MKQKDIALVIVVVFISGIASYFISSKLFTTPSDRQQEVEVVQPISSDFQNPSDKYFSNDSINPTQNIRIGDDRNNQPF